MTLLEYVQTLSSDISVAEKIALTKSWKKKNEPAQETVQQTVVEEEVKINPAVETDAPATGTIDGASESSSSGDLALNISLNKPDNSILFGWQKDITPLPKEPEIIGKLDIDLSVKPLNEMIKDLKASKKELYGDVDFIPGEIKKGKGNYEYKYEIVENEKKEKTREFYFKGANDTDWINQSERIRKKPKSDVLQNQMVGILSELGFMSEEAGKNAYKIQKQNEKIRELNKQRKEYNEFQEKIDNYWKEKNKNVDINPKSKFEVLKNDNSGGFYNRNKNVKERLAKNSTGMQQEQYTPGYYSDFNYDKESNQSDQVMQEQYYIKDSFGLVDKDSFLAEALGPELTKKFIGYLNKNDLSKDLLNNVLAGNFGVHGVALGKHQNIYDKANEAYDNLSGGGAGFNFQTLQKAEVARQRRLSTYLSNFLLENKQMEDNKILDGYASLNPDKFKGITNVVVKRAKARSLISELSWNEEGFTSFDSLDYEKIGVYLDNFFPQLKAVNDKTEAARTERIAEVQKKGGWNGFLYETMISMEDNVLSRAQQFGHLILSDILNFDTRFSMIQEAEGDAQELGMVKKPFVSGKTSTIAGTEYVLEDGVLYEAETNTPVLNQDILVPGTEDKVMDIVKGSNKTTTSFSGSASTTTAAGALTGLAVDIFGTKGIGRATGLLRKVGIRNIVKLPQARLDGMLYWSGLGYAQGKLDTYQQLIAAGRSEEEAGELSDQAAAQTSILYGAAGIFSPTEKYFNAFEKTVNFKQTVRNAVTQFTKSGNKKSWGEIFKSYLPTKAGTFNTVKAAGGEIVEETGQEAVTSLVINENINQQLGVDVLDAEFTTSDLATTVTISMAVSGAATNIKMPGSTNNYSQLNSSLFMMGQNPADTKKSLDNLIKNGEITQQQSSEIMAQVRAIINQSPNIPNFVSPKALLESSMLLQDIEDLRVKKKNQNEAFHPETDAAIVELQEQLAEITKPEIENSMARKGSRKAAEQIGGIEFQTFSDQESIDNKKSELESEGGTVQKSVGYGEAIDMSEVKGWSGANTIILINDQVAGEDNVYTTDQHEVLHPFWQATFKNNPELAIRFGKSLMAEIVNNPDITGGSKFIARFQQYLSDDNYTADMTWEEVIPLVSEALASGDIVYNEKQNGFWKGIGKQISTLFSSSKKDPLNIKFNTGKDVFDFIRGYNQSIESGEGLTKAQLKVAKEGAKGDIVDGTNKIDGRTKGAKVNKALDAGMVVKAETEVEQIISKESKKDTGIEASNKVQEIFETQGTDGAFEIIEQFGPIVSKIVEKRSEAPNFDRQLLTDEINTGKRGIIDLVAEYKPESGVPLAAYINKFLPARAIEASQRVLGEEFTTDVTEAKGVMAEEVTTEVATKPVKRKIKPSSLISNDAVGKIKEQVQEKIKGIDPKNLTFKKLGDLAPEIIAEEIGIPVKKLTAPAANLSKGDATAIQQFVNKNADKLLKILPQGAVVEAATEKLLGTSTGVPKGLLDAFYTKKARLGKGAGLAPFVLNKGISKADFLKAFGIVDGKKQEGFNARSSQAQALKGIASLYGKLVTNEIVRSDTDLSLETKQDVAAGKNTSMASLRANAESSTGTITGRTLKNYTVKQLNDLGFKSLGDVKEFLGLPLLPARTIGGKKRKADKNIPLKSGYKILGGNLDLMTDAINTFLEEYPQYREIIRKSTTSSLGRSSMGSTKIFDKQIPKGDQIYKIITRDPYKDSKRKLSKTFVKKTNEKDFLKDQYAKLEYLENYWLDVQSFINKNPKLDFLFEQMLDDAQNDMGSLMRISPPILYLPLNSKGEIDFSVEIREEHNMPQNNVGSMLLAAAINGDVKNTFKIVSAAYMQGPLTMADDNKVNVKYGRSMPDFFWDVMVPRILSGDLKIPEGTASLIRLVESDISLDGYKFLPENKTFSEYFFGTNGLPTNIQKKLLKDFFSGDITLENARKQGLAYNKLAPGMNKASKRNNDIMPKDIKYNRDITVPMSIDALAKTDKALELARKLDQPVKKIRVFDFDDTLARSKSMVIVNMPNGSSKKINATQFAQQAADLELEGAEFDFAEFSEVVEGKKGPLFEVAQKIADARGTEDVFILTARPQNADGPIKAFMKANGIDIPLKNITGLGDGTAEAKAGWMMGKAAEGYNDFYFADDAIKNVQAVKNVLSQVDVKSKVQLAKASKRDTFDTIVNDMIEDSSGIETYKQYSAARAQTVGASKGRFNFFIPASAEDFTGLLYKMLGKGKKGDAQMAFLKTNLLDPYDRAESAVTQAKIAAANDFKALKQNLKTLPKSLSKPTGIGGFTFSHAVRVAVWSKQGMDIPGLSKKDIKELNDFVDNNAELSVFTDELMKIQKGKPYPKPGKSWLGGNITGDIINDINKVNRAEYQQEWRENVDIIFSEDNMNKMEAAYGSKWRRAMEDSLRRMKSGSNRPPGGNSVTDGLLDWLNNSVGAVMFLNTRSALLQTISAVNFINWGDNNIVKAGVAFANQKQFWGDFMTLMNSDYLVERRNGLKINVSESEIADAVRDSDNKVKAAIAFLLSKGFVMTRFADSFAIATGGSTFYRNRVKTLVGKGMEQKAAEAQAFEDFRQIAEESQQSSNPNRISQQQASGAGRVILAWANTPMQYARIQKRAAQDLINGRGDWKTNVSKIVYYGAVQNLIFNALQQAVFALGFGEDDEEEMDAKKSEKISRIANGMIDSQLKGLGIGGAAVVALKSTLMELGKQYSKDRPKYEEAVFDLLGFSPPLGSKVQKIYSGLRSFSWNMKDIKDKGLSLDNPAYLAGAQITTGLTNIPLDRVIKKLNSMRGIVSEQSSLWQKVALGLGWSTWDVGLGYYGGFDAAKVLTPEEERVKEIDDMKKLTKTQEQIDMLLDLGLTKKEIKALGKEQVRVEKIIELQNAEAEPKKEAKVKEEIKEETKPTPEIKAKPKTESVERRLRRQFDSIKDENKPDQVKTLLKFGLTKKQIRELQYEKNRVNKILELMEKNK